VSRFPGAPGCGLRPHPTPASTATAPGHGCTAGQFHLQGFWPPTRFLRSVPGSLRDHLPPVDDGHPSQPDRLPSRSVCHTRGPLAPQLAHDSPYHRAAARIHPVVGLVEEQHLRGSAGCRLIVQAGGAAASRSAGGPPPAPGRTAPSSSPARLRAAPPGTVLNRAADISSSHRPVSSHRPAANCPVSPQLTAGRPGSHALTSRPKTSAPAAAWGEHRGQDPDSVVFLARPSAQQAEHHPAGTSSRAHLAPVRRSA